MKKLMIGIGILILNACHLTGKGNGIKCYIKNDSEQVIRDVKFFTSEKLAIATFDKIAPGENVSDYLTMKNNKSDGDYILEFMRENGTIEKYDTGYYTNGRAMNNWIEFNIKSDTIYAELKGMKY